MAPKALRRRESIAASHPVPLQRFNLSRSMFQLSLISGSLSASSRQRVVAKGLDFTFKRLDASRRSGRCHFNVKGAVGCRYFKVPLRLNRQPSSWRHGLCTAFARLKLAPLGRKNPLTFPDHKIIYAFPSYSQTLFRGYLTTLQSLYLSTGDKFGQTFRGETGYPCT